MSANQDNSDMPANQDMDNLRAQLAVAITALKFYAECNHFDIDDDGHRIHRSVTDQGEVAERALQQLRATAAFDMAAVVTERDHLKALINTPEILDFVKAVPLEAAHQRLRWDDEGKTDGDWFWLVGYLAAKTVHKESTTDKLLHWIISIAAAAANWHAAVLAKGGRRGPAVASFDIRQPLYRLLAKAKLRHLPAPVIGEPIKTSGLVEFTAEVDVKDLEALGNAVKPLQGTL